MDIVCKSGINREVVDCKAEYCSTSIPKDDQTSNFFYTSKIIFSVDESLKISFYSEHFIQSGKYEGKKYIENGQISLLNTITEIEIEGLERYLEPNGNEYTHIIKLPNGMIYLTQKALIKLKAAINEEHKSIIEKNKTILIKREQNAQEQERYFLMYLKQISEEWQKPWENNIDTWRKIQIFTESIFFSVMLDVERLHYYEQSFCQRWISVEYKDEIQGILQSKFLEGEKARLVIKNSEKERKLNLLIKLVANECQWDITFAACRTYSAIIYFTKKKCEEILNSDFGFRIEDGWDYLECVKQFSNKLISAYIENSQLLSYFAYYLILKNKMIPENSFESEFMSTKFYYMLFNLVDDIAPYKENHKERLEIFRLNKELSTSFSKQSLTIEDMDLMSGQEFEKAIASIFKKMSYKVTLTPATKDQGVDIIAEKGEMRLGIQTKCYTGKVGNSAIQEIVAGKNYYQLNRCMVVTNSTFTTSAIELARVNNVVLWDRNILIEKIKSYE